MLNGWMAQIVQFDEGPGPWLAKENSTGNTNFWTEIIWTPDAIWINQTMLRLG